MSKRAFRLVCTATNVEHDIGFYSATVGSFTDCVRLRLLWCSSDFTTSTLLSTRTSTLHKQKAKHGFRETTTQAKARAEESRERDADRPTRGKTRKRTGGSSSRLG